MVPVEFYKRSKLTGRNVKDKKAAKSYNASVKRRAAKSAAVHKSGKYKSTVKKVVRRKK